MGRFQVNGYFDVRQMTVRCYIDEVSMLDRCHADASSLLHQFEVDVGVDFKSTAMLLSGGCQFVVTSMWVDVVVNVRSMLYRYQADVCSLLHGCQVDVRKKRCQ